KPLFGVLLVVWRCLGGLWGEAYEAVVSIVSPGQQYLTGESLHSLFNTLEHRVHCGEVPCEKCDLADAVHQLIGNPDFTALASGSVLYLSSPGLVCTAIKTGTWGEETEKFLHKFTHNDPHEHKSEANHDHEHIDVHGLEGVIQELRSHYDPTESEVDASSGDQKQEVGAVLGYVLYHALQGHCFADQSLPDESFFVNYIMEQLGSENFTILGKSRCKLYNGCLSASSGLGRPGVVQLSPALVQQILSGACADITDPEKPDGLSKAERYLYATIANFLITVISMFGIVVLLCAACTSVFQMCIQFCISLAVGSLTGDALLHLMPTFLGLHVHSDNGGSSEHSSHSHEEETPDYVYKMLVLIAGIYCFYLMEVSFSLITYGDKHNDHKHHHGVRRKQENSSYRTHCVMCDFAILLNCGLSVRKALALNIASTLTSFIGMYVALSVATDLATQQWIGAITAGLFLYVGLADMLPTMIHISNKKPWLTFLLQNVGLLAGWGILLLLSLYEEKISF
uniref:Zinc transporter ZIP4 n=1 Tax=Astatotilapia calliptera TaxID=8154 RepID=A0AAX7V8C0_ASTCA